MNCLIDPETPPCGEVATWWPGLQPWHKLPRFQELACSPFLSVYKSPCPLTVSGDESASGVCFPSTRPPYHSCCIQNKANFPPTLPLYWVLSSGQLDPTFSYIITQCALDGCLLVTQGQTTCDRQCERVRQHLRAHHVFHMASDSFNETLQFWDNCGFI